MARVLLLERHMWMDVVVSTYSSQGCVLPLHNMLLKANVQATAQRPAGDLSLRLWGGSF